MNNIISKKARYPAKRLSRNSLKPLDFIFLWEKNFTLIRENATKVIMKAGMVLAAKNKNNFIYFLALLNLL